MQNDDDQNRNPIVKLPKVKKAKPSVVQSLPEYETHAQVLREQAGVTTGAPLDPRLLTARYQIKIVDLGNLITLSEADKNSLRTMDAKEWSGMSVPLGDGSFAVVLHPVMTQGRTTVTLMEEIVHVYYEHKPSDILTQSNGLMKRVYDEAIETQAFQTAAAALLPSQVVATHVWRKRPIHELAARFGVSEELVQMRIKLMGLWPHHDNQNIHNGASQS